MKVVIIGGVAGGASAVSYTHLDVYKRQFLIRIGHSMFLQRQTEKLSFLTIMQS